MSTVEYKLDGDSQALVSSLEEAIREMAAATQASNDLKVAQQQMTAAQKAAAAAQREAAAAQRAANAESAKSEQTFRSVLSVVRSFGGEASSTARHLGTLATGVEGLSSSLGPAGVAAAALTVGVAGVGLAATEIAGKLSDLAVAAEAAKDHLEKMGIAVDTEAAAQLGAYAAGTRQLDVALDQLKVASGSQVAENIGAIDTALSGLVTTLAKSKTGVTTLESALFGILGNLTIFQAEFDALFGSEEEQNKHLAAVQKLHEQYTSALNDMAKTSKDSTDKMLSDLKDLEAEDRKAEAIKDAAADKAVANAAAEEKAAEQKYLSELRWGESFYNSLLGMVKKQEEAEQKLHDAEDQWTKERADEAKQAAQEAIAQLDTELAAWEAAQKKKEELLKSIVDEAGQFLDEETSMVVDAMNAQWDAQLSQLDDQISKQQALVDKLKNSDDAADKARLKSQIDALNGLEAEKRRIAYDSFKAEQQSAVGQAILQSGVAIVTAFAQLGPIGGAIAASFIAAMTATQVGIIEAQSPPPAHDGGVLGADEFNVGNRRVRQGEAAVIFNQRAVQTGALDTAQRINRDQGGGAQSEVRLVLADAGRVVGELVARETRRPGSRLAAAFGSTGVIDPYGRAR